jgi:hypothetical protein
MLAQDKFARRCQSPRITLRVIRSISVQGERAKHKFSRESEKFFSHGKLTLQAFVDAFTSHRESA